MAIYTLMKYYGSKRRMVPVINSCLPNDYKVWIEGFMGYGAVSLNRDCPPTCKVNIVNEKELGIYDFWKVLADKDKGKELMNLLKTVKGDREVFDKAHRTVKYPSKDISEAEYAKCVYLETVLSFNGLREHYGKQRKARDFQTMVDKHMNPVYEKFQKQNINVLNWDMLDLLKEIRNQPEEIQKGIMLYLDPPYLFDVRAKNACKAYKHEMLYQMHVNMLDILRHLKCRVLLSGYLNQGYDLYCEMLLPYGYQCYFGKELKKTCSKKETETGKEFLWCNYELPKGAQVKLYPYQSKVIWTP